MDDRQSASFIRLMKWLLAVQVILIVCSHIILNSLEDSLMVITQEQSLTGYKSQWCLEPWAGLFSKECMASDGSIAELYGWLFWGYVATAALVLAGFIVVAKRRFGRFESFDKAAKTVLKSLPGALANGVVTLCIFVVVVGALNYVSRTSGPGIGQYARPESLEMVLIEELLFKNTVVVLLLYVVFGFFQPRQEMPPQK